MNALAILGVDFRAFLRCFDRNLWREDVKALVCPVLSGGAAFDRAKTTAQSGITWLHCLVCHRRGRRVQRRNWIAIQKFKAKHRLSESQTAQTGARWRACGDLSVGALNKWIQAVDRGEDTTGGNQTPLDQITTRDLACRIGLQNLCAIFEIGRASCR